MHRKLVNRHYREGETRVRRGFRIAPHLGEKEGWQGQGQDCPQDYQDKESVAPEVGADTAVPVARTVFLGGPGQRPGHSPSGRTFFFRADHNWVPSFFQRIRHFSLSSRVPGK